MGSDDGVKETMGCARHWSMSVWGNATPPHRSPRWCGADGGLVSGELRAGEAGFTRAVSAFVALYDLADQSVTSSSRMGRMRSGGRSRAVPMWMNPATFSPTRTPRAA
jgi:hypothetical protein